MKSFLIVNHPVPSVGLGGKVEDSLLAIKKVTNTSRSRAVGGSENLEVPVLFGGDNLPPLVEIGLSDLPKSGGAMAPPAPPETTPLSRSTTAAAPKVTKPTPLSFEKRRFGNHTNARGFLS